MTTSRIESEEVVSAAEANRQFSRILREVHGGRAFLITSHGRPVARITPADDENHTSQISHSALIARLEGQSVIDIGPWSRGELYEDDPGDAT
ncbi:MAG TPA: type II toxin-antitoxin system Phd/YefM family antitoxin [Trueperaceae bacterium]|nr:type II toxin-antitoxin system Phd/YefM family antitoxin [Trueperaceae bacterium]